MPAITRWSRSTACSGRAPCGASSSASGGGSGHASGPSLATASSSLDGRRVEQLDPCRLLGPELAQAQLAPVLEPHQQPRGPVARRRALVEQLQAAGGHQVQQQREIAADVDDEVLADPPHARDGTPGERAERRVERLQRVDAGRQRRLDRRPAQRRVQPPGRDLDLGQLGHAAPRGS